MVEKQKPYVAGGELIVPYKGDAVNNSQISLTGVTMQGFQQGLNAKQIKEEIKKKKWSPNLSTKPLKQGSGNLLEVAKLLIKHRFSEQIINTICDSKGLVAFETTRFILTAKGYVYGSIVSAHLRVLELALSKSKTFVMFIADSKKFYKFDAKQCIEEGSLNMRDDVPMVNFEIKLEVNLENATHV